MYRRCESKYDLWCNEFGACFFTTAVACHLFCVSFFSHFRMLHTYVTYIRSRSERRERTRMFLNRADNSRRWKWLRFLMARTITARRERRASIRRATNNTRDFSPSSNLSENNSCLLSVAYRDSFSSTLCILVLKTAAKVPESSQFFFCYLGGRVCGKFA